MVAQPSGAALVSAHILLSKGMSGALAADGTTLRYSTTRPGQAGRYTFTGTAGQRFALRATVASGFSTYGATVTVDQPNGVTIVATQFSTGLDQRLNLGALTATGSYTVAVVPSALQTGAIDLSLIEGATGTLSIGGAAQPLSLAAAQSGRYTFNGNAGDWLGLAVTSVAITPAGTANISLLKPDGSSLWSSTLSASSTSWQPGQLPSSGTYTLAVTPSGTSSFSFSPLLSNALIGTIAPSGAVTRYETARPGQAGRYTFTGTAGQRFTLRATIASGFSTNGAVVTVYQPSGTAIVNTQFSTGIDQKLDLGALPSTGTYTVGVVPASLQTGSINLSLIEGATAALSIGSATQGVTISAAQNGRYTFSGNAGDWLGMAVTAVTITPTGSANISIRNPDGTILWSGFLSASSTTWQPGLLPSSGIYTLVVTPPGTSSCSFSVMLSNALTGALTSGGVTRHETAREGQAGRYTFTGTAGQRFTLRAAMISGFGTYGATVTVYQPSGASIAYTQFSTGTDQTLSLAALPATGTYTVAVVPNALKTGTIDLSLVVQ
ncbi:MAG: hypothetical protein QM767_10520 [Anaeromyxobacter sp.]